MSARLRTRPLLEYLEDRTVPATVRLVNGMLLISNPTIMGSSTSLTVTQDPTIQNRFTVKDGMANNGTYSSVGNINITGSNANDLVTINLNNNTYTGSLSINTENGNDTVAITGGGAAGNGINGSVSLLHGSGNESVNLNTVAGNGLNVGGNVTATNTSSGGHSIFQLGNTGAVTSVGGSVTLTDFADNGATPAVQIGGGQFDTIGGALNVQSATVNNNVTVDLGKVVTAGTLARGVMIGNGFTVQAGSGNDTVAILGANIADNVVGGNTKSPNVGTIINGDTYISLGNGNDYFDVVGARVPGQPIGGQETTFNGNVTYNAGSGSDSINLAGFGRGTGVGTTINGNLNINLGDGNNNFGDLAVGGGNNGGFDFVESNVTGNLNLTSGNGNNVMDFFGLNVQGTEEFNFGSGNNGTAAVPIQIHSPGSKLIWNSGNGRDYLRLTTPLINGAPFLFNVDIHFGNSDDTFQLGGSPGDQGGSITGTVDGGGRLTANVFLMDPTLWTIVAPFTLSNFP